MAYRFSRLNLLDESGDEDVEIIVRRRTRSSRYYRDRSRSNDEGERERILFHRYRRNYDSESEKSVERNPEPEQKEDPDVRSESGDEASVSWASDAPRLNDNTLVRYGRS
jgi:hypothetical protein